MQETNPYATPNSKVNDIYSEEGFGEVKVFTSNGRMGRLRYFLYGMLIGIAGMALIVLAFLLLSVSPIIGGILIGLVYIGMILASILITIQRCHDFNTSGWLSLLILLFPVSLIFYFIPGTKGSNQYGLRPPPNSKGVIISSILLPLLLILLSVIFGFVISKYENKNLSEMKGNQETVGSTLEAIESKDQ